MQDTSTLRTIRLTEYLIEQGAGADPGAQAAIFAKICSGALPASLTVHPELPAGASALDIHRCANTQTREVSALSIPRLKNEIMKAALGRDVDWTLLDILSLRIPDATPALTQLPVKAVQREQAHKKNVLAAIKVLGYDPKKLLRKNGIRGVKGEVRDHIGSSIQRKAFDKAWQSLRDEKLIDDA